MKWIGIPRALLDPDELRVELSAMIENAGGFGPQAWFALLRRHRVERRLASIVQLARDGKLDESAARPFRQIWRHRDRQGALLSGDEVVVETLNLLRPIVAVARFIAFAVAALAARPDISARLETDDAVTERFCE